MSDQSQRDPAGLRARFEQTALPHLRRVYNVAMRLARRPEDASDLAQETYLRAFRTFERFQPGTNCRSWLLTILYSVFINRYRKRKREGEQLPVEVLERDVHGRLTSGLQDVEWTALRAANFEAHGSEVARALEQLPESFRVAVLLVDVEGLGYEEAAEALRCPVGTLRSRLFRARKLLFMALRDYAERAGYLKRSGGD
jgi:RNA polymerase sigma-70 factor (ECF subfamily)